MEAFYCDKCNKECIYYLISRETNYYLIRNCCYEQFLYINKQKKMSNLSKNLNENHMLIDKELLVPFEGIIKCLLKYQNNKNISKFKYINQNNKEEIIFDKHNKDDDYIYNSNIIKIEKYLKDLEKIKNEKIMNLIYKKKMKKISIEKYINYINNIQLFLKYYQLLYEHYLKKKNIILYLTLNIHEFKDFDELLSEFKYEKDIEKFINKFDNHENFIINRLKNIDEFKEINIGYSFQTENYVSPNKLPSAIYLGNLDEKFEILEYSFIIFKESIILLYYYGSLYYINILCYNNKFSTKVKSYEKFDSWIMKVISLHNNDILVLTKRTLNIVLVNEKSEEFFLKKKFSFDTDLFDIEILNLSNRILVEDRNQKIIIFKSDIENIPEGEFSFKDLCEKNYSNDLFGYQFDIKIKKYEPWKGRIYFFVMK